MIAVLTLIPLLVVVAWLGRSFGIGAFGGGTGGQFAARIPVLTADYLQTEGHARRGPKFEQLALALNHKALGGSPPTEAEMVQLLGPPDLMQRGPAAADASFVYFYDRFAQKDWVVFVDYRSGALTMGYNATSANASVYGQMRPYAPLPATRPAHSIPGPSPAN